ncbi:Alpha/Beta hydrolase protein [Hyaloraphidium curvatum]|nr:Alpha/Beta hydrolase protein [Hyaloraphidium curvatum]
MPGKEEVLVVSVDGAEEVPRADDPEAGTGDDGPSDGPADSEEGKRRKGDDGEPRKRARRGARSRKGKGRKPTKADKLAAQGFDGSRPHTADVPVDGRTIAVEIRGGEHGGIGAVEYAALLASDKLEGPGNRARPAQLPRHPIVASHGLRGRRQDAFFMLGLLLPLYPVAFFDARGHGASAPAWLDAEPGDFTWETVARDVVAVVDWAVQRPDLSMGPEANQGKAVVFGKSMTCAATLHALVDPEQRERIAAAILYKVPTMGDGREERGKVLQAEAPTRPPPLSQVLAGIATSDLPPLSAIQSVPHIPVLILSPLGDPNHPLSSAEAVFDALTSSRADTGEAVQGAAKAKGAVELWTAEGEAMEEAFRAVVKEWVGRVVGRRVKVHTEL